MGNRIVSSFSRFAVALAMVALAGASAQAATINLADGVLSHTFDNGTPVNLTDDVVFGVFTSPAGNGVAVTFVRVENPPNRRNDHDGILGTAQGYNTSGRTSGQAPYDGVENATFTKNLQLFQISTATLLGIEYFDFYFDINEPGTGSHALAPLSLTDLRIYTSSTPSLTAESFPLGDLRWEMPAGDDLFLRASASGSGFGDYQLLVPTSLFATDDPTDYLYLYFDIGSELGSLFSGEAADSSQDGWSYRDNGATSPPPSPPGIPLPGAAWMGLVLLGGMVAKRRRRLA